MALNLDTRQRAMLQEMGITLWLPKPAAPTLISNTAALPSTAENTAVIDAPAPAVAAAAVATPVAPVAPVIQPAIAPAAAAVPATPTVAATPSAESAPAVTWQMAPAVQAYPTAQGGSADDAWLVIWECPNPNAPLVGDSGKLLNNMLRALRLHLSAHVWIAGMQRPGHQALPVAGLPSEPVVWQDLPQGLTACMQRTRPARILVLGMHAARALLDSQEALGRLRAQIHHIHNTPAVVSYDPAYLLRSPHAKPAAWADLCRAHALRPPSAH